MLKYQRKEHLVKKKCGTQRLCLFIFRCMALKQLKSLTTMPTFNWLGGQEVTHHIAVLELPSWIPGSDRDYLLVFFASLVLYSGRFG